MVKEEGKIQKNMKDVAETKVMSYHFLFYFNQRKKSLSLRL